MPDTFYASTTKIQGEHFIPQAYYGWAFWFSYLHLILPRWVLPSMNKYWRSWKSVWHKEWGYRNPANVQIDIKPTLCAPITSSVCVCCFDASFNAKSLKITWFYILLSDDIISFVHLSFALGIPKKKHKSFNRLWREWSFTCKFVNLKAILQLNWCSWNDIEFNSTNFFIDTFGHFICMKIFMLEPINE